MFDAECRVSGRRRSEIVIHKQWGWKRDPRRRYKLLADGRRALIAKAGECKRGTATWRRTESTKLRRRAVVHGAIQVGGVSLKLAQLRMISVDNPTGFSVGIAGRFGIHRLLKLAIETAEHDPWTANRLQRVPGNRDLRRCIRAELQMQPSH